MSTARPRPWWSPRRWRLGTRIALMSVALLLLLQAVSYERVGEAIEHNARQSLSQELVVAERIWQRLLAQRAEQLQQAARLIAADAVFQAVARADDLDRLVQSLDQQGRRTGASLVVWMDGRFLVRAQTSDAPVRLLPLVDRLAPALARSGQAVADLGGHPLQFVMVPVQAPELNGWLLMGFPLDGRLLDDLESITEVHGTLRSRDVAGEVTLLTTSFDGTHEGHGHSPGGRPPHGHLDAQMLATLPADTQRARLGDELFELRRVVVAHESGQNVDLWLARSVSAAVAPYRALQLTLAMMTAIGLLIFGAGAVWAARRVTQPLATLAHTAERLGGGDLDTPVAAPDREDELGELAAAFERMRRNLVEQRDAVQRAAWWDRLTGLPNREQFRDAVTQAITRQQPHAVVMLDLDRFKHINDVLGYATGDRALCHVAARLRDAVRQEDLVARVGGNGFAMLLPGADATSVQAAAGRVLQVFEQPLDIDEQRIDLSAALGLACWPAHGADADTLLSRAEVAMYAAKRNTNGAQLWEPLLETANVQNLSLLSDLRKAIVQDELRLYLQPKVRLSDGALVGVEGLVRWQHPQRGLVPPMQFIPYAEQTGFVRELTLWVFDEGARQQARLAAIGIDRLSINLSTRDLMDSALPDKLEVLLQRRGARAEGFCLEITESAIMDDPPRAEMILNRLARRGYKLSIDDFGTGYSSLGYLRRLPVHELKIDRSFVTALDSLVSDQAIVKGTIDLAHSLGLSVVAEGVENAGVVERLRELGCDEAQGYHYSRPVPLDELATWSERSGHPGAPSKPLRQPLAATPPPLFAFDRTGDTPAPKPAPATQKAIEAAARRPAEGSTVTDDALADDADAAGSAGPQEPAANSPGLLH